ncbi:ABC transporter permease [Pseudokineococcus sp. 1T1Z-3]|uniref:ABC transporter permease n=1 Tax=Pseudokineococcus sp. 1T1Z-3 TaxID=3132745 RepID=UPI0030960B95
MSTRAQAPTAAQPRAAGAAARVLAQARWEAGTMLRNGEQVLLTLVLPALVLVGLSVTSVVDLGLAPGQAAVDVVAPGVLALAVLSTAFTGQAIATGFDRRSGVLRLLATTPLGRGGLLAGRVLGVLVVEVVQVLVLGAVALAVGWRPDPLGLLPGALLVLVGTAALTALALLLAGVLRAEAVLAAANLVWALLLVGGGVVVPADALPGAWGALVHVLPSGALGEGLRQASTDGSLDVVALLVLLAWAAAATLAARRWFRWD